MYPSLLLGECLSPGRPITFIDVKGILAGGREKRAANGSPFRAVIGVDPAEGKAGENNRVAGHLIRAGCLTGVIDAIRFGEIAGNLRVRGELQHHKVVGIGREPLGAHKRIGLLLRGFLTGCERDEGNDEDREKGKKLLHRRKKRL